MPVEVKPRSGVFTWTAFWTVVSFAWLSYAQQPPPESYKPSQAEASAFFECEQTVLGELSQEKRIRTGIYDYVYREWLIQGERADELIRCLVERHKWIGLKAPDGRRGARVPRLEDFTKAVEIDPHNAQAYWDRAAVRGQIGDGSVP